MLADQCWWATSILSIGGISVNSTRTPSRLPWHFMYMYHNGWSLVNITWMWQWREVPWLTFPHVPDPIPSHGYSARQWGTRQYELILYCGNVHISYCGLLFCRFYLRFAVCLACFLSFEHCFFLLECVKQVVSSCLLWFNLPVHANQNLCIL